MGLPAWSEQEPLVRLVERLAQTRPEDLAFAEIAADGSLRAQLDYGNLHDRARRTGQALHQAGLQGQRVLIMLPQGLDAIVAVLGCLYAGATAVPLPMPSPDRLARTLPRILAVARDAGATGVISLPAVRDAFGQIAPPEAKDWQWRSPAELANAPADARSLPEPVPDQIAYLQYTSGSTGDPKGVIITHGALMTHLHLARQVFHYGPDSVSAVWMPYFHDFGLVDGIFQPLYGGTPCYVLSPVDFLKRPRLWLETISRYRATHSAGPNFAFDLCLNIPATDLAGLDLSSWQVAPCGAEPIRLQTIERFLAHVAPVGFRPESFWPGYGLAEATLLVTLHAPGTPIVHTSAPGKRVLTLGEPVDGKAIVGCGRAGEGITVRIVDPESRQVRADGKEGEIWVAHGGLAVGYWQRPVETAETFQAHLATGEGPFLRTGDLGFLQNGELFLTGRQKDLIIVAGTNHYPQDLEWTAESAHARVRRSGCAAFSVDDGEHEQVVLVAEIDDPTADPTPVFQALRQAIAETHGVELHATVLLPPGRLPKTSSGKVQRRACRQRYLDGDLPAVAVWRRQDHARSAITAPSDPQAIRQWLTDRIAEVTGLSSDAIGIETPFAAFGIGSLQAVSLVGDLERHLGRPLPETLLWHYPTIAALSAHLTSSIGPSSAHAPDPAPIAGPNAHDPIAIVGIGCRFPGAPAIPAFWQLLLNGDEAITEVPASRWPIDAFYDPAGEAPDRMFTRWGAFLENVDQFDPAFFGLSVSEAIHMDPQQRLLLEVAWETLENADIRTRDLAGSDVGVFVGVSGSDYYKRMTEPPTRAGTGIATSIAANRLSYLFDWHGPSLTIDTACSSSLVAVHQACQSLRTGESRLALAGGVNLILAPELTIAVSQAGMMAKDGRCKTFDADADGYVRGEGCGLVLLKRLSDAQQDGDRIWAVIQGSAVNQDGRSNGLTAPNGQAQVAVVTRALAAGGVAPASIGYVEAHGSGTPLGDPIEVESLQHVLQQDRHPEVVCHIGSVKTNMGHLETAAGIAGLLKTVLVLHHGIIPPHRNLKTLNPRIHLEGTAFRIPQGPVPWAAGDRPRYAGVSSFGFGGTNAHVVLGEAPTANPMPTAPDTGVQTLLLSAKHENALPALASAYAEMLDHADPLALAAICHGTATGREPFPHRLAVTASDAGTMTNALRTFMTGGKAKGLKSSAAGRNGTPKVVFLYPGQGAQATGMAAGVYAREPVFREAFDQCAHILDPLLGTSLRALVHPGPGEIDRLQDTTYAQPALFAVCYALTVLWRHWGIEPDAVIGHSVGEYVAACVAGILPLESALKLIAKRGQLMGALPAGSGMMAVFADEASVRTALAAGNLPLDIAAINGPRHVVVAGALADLSRLGDHLDPDVMLSEPFRVSHAFHSRWMDPMLAPFGEVAAQLPASPPKLTYVSNVDGRIVDADWVPDADYWMRHVRQSVRFADGLQALSDADFRLFLEVGPGQTLSKLGARVLPTDQATWVASLPAGESDEDGLRRALADLWVHGADPNWQQMYAGTRTSPVTLPTYPFQRRTCWLPSLALNLPEAP